ncbi:hypothetical protein [Microvirga calopogonii]|uniref:hypothetical protein n=1 Tax=Microvirga calopogonii TaxID=2078013 RepID=UPI000E0CC853|nr:hypothetical protein [Microvirga calopogonii]
MKQQLTTNQARQKSIQGGAASQERELVALMPNALSASDWERSGKTFDPDLHVTSARGQAGDPEGWKATVETLQKHGLEAVAYHYAPDFFLGGFSLEVEFSTSQTGSRAVAMWNSFFDEDEEE